MKGWTDNIINDRHRSTGYNSTFNKLAVQCLNEALCFVSGSVLADSFVLRFPPPSPSAKPLGTSH